LHLQVEFTKILIKALREFYSPALLALLQCNFNEEKTGNWPVLILSHLKKATANHPIRYLLLIHLLGHTVESFFDMCTNTVTKGPRISAPFGRGPWPCLNSTCVNYRKLVIETYQIKPMQSVKYQTHGLFTCSCGFTYVRHGPERSPDSRFRYYRIERYGHVWEAKLKRLWADPSISLRSIVGCLGVNREAIKNHAATLSLSASRIGPRNRKTLIGEISKNYENKRRAKALRLAKERKARRVEFLTVRRNHPKASHSELQAISVRVYVWLCRNDKKWLGANLPPPRKRDAYSRRPLSWAERDAIFEKQVRLAASALRNLDARPIRITTAAIIRYIDEYLPQSNTGAHLINSKWFLDKVPLTAKALSEVTETTLDCWCRKLEWASERFRKEGVCPPRWQLMDCAGISRKSLTAPLATLVDEILSSLQKAPTKDAYRAA
jgi:hypothetical protein